MLLRKNFGIKESTQRYNPEDQHWHSSHYLSAGREVHRFCFLMEYVPL
jgi:hypothetical protein